MINLQTILQYNQEYLELIKLLQIPNIKTNSLLQHENIQHLNEILLSVKNKDIIYFIFDIKYFSENILSQKFLQQTKLIQTVKNLPDGIWFNTTTEKIQTAIQFKTNFNCKYLNTEKLHKLNINYDPYWIDKIKINFILEEIYRKQIINESMFPRIEKTYITEDFILSKKEELISYKKEINLKKYEYFKQKMYKIMKEKYLINMIQKIKW